MFTRQQNITGDVRIPLELGEVGLTATSSLTIKYIPCNKDGVPTGAPVSITLSNGPDITGSWSPGNFAPLYSGSTSYMLRPPSAAFNSPRTLYAIVTPQGSEKIGEISNPNWSVVESGSLTTEYANGVWNTSRGSRTSGTFGSYLDLVLSSVTGTLNTTNIATAVWANGTRTLTSIDSASVANAVWIVPNRIATSSLSASTISDAVWNTSRGSRTSGTFGSYLDLVLSSVTGTLNTTNIATAVWANGTRTLTSIDSASVANAVWSAANRTVTASISGTVIADSSAIAEAVWNTSRGVRAAGTFGYYLDSLVSTSTGSIDSASIASAVWNVPVRSLTITDTVGITTAVWTNGTRTLTSIDSASVANAVWINGVRTLTSSSVDQPSVASAVWGAARSTFQASGTYGQGISMVYGVNGNINGNINGNLTGSVALLGTNSITSGSFTGGATDRITNNLLDLAGTIESDVTVRGALRILASALAGTTSGSGTSTIEFRNVGGVTSRIIATVNPATGERTSITLNI